MISVEDAVTDFCERLHAAQIQYIVGGSMASGVWGEPRQTHDVDLEVWVSQTNADAFQNAFPEPYWVDREILDEALRSEVDFPMVQVLRTDIMLKFDCFLQRPSEFADECMSRAHSIELTPGKAIQIASAEQILVQKLRWFELGGRASERQWRDLLGITKTSKKIDWNFVERWANFFSISDILEQLRHDSGRE